MELCENCGYENKKDSIACERCGALLDETYRKEQELERQRLKKVLEMMQETY